MRVWFSQGTQYLCGLLSIPDQLPFVLVSLTEPILFSGIAGFGGRWNSLGFVLFSYNRGHYGNDKVKKEKGHI